MKLSNTLWSKQSWRAVFFIAFFITSFLLTLVLAACSDSPTPTNMPSFTTAAATASRNTQSNTAAVPAATSTAALPTAIPASPTPTTRPATATAKPPTPTPPPPSKDGRWLAYRTPDNILYVSRADGTNKRKVDQDVQTIEWAPDGTQLIYYKSTQGYMFATSYDGSNPHQLTSVKGFGHWLPSGKNILIPPATTTSRQYNIISSAGKTVTTFELPVGSITDVFDLTADGQNVIYTKVTPDTAGTNLRPAEYHLLTLANNQDKVLAVNLVVDKAVWNDDGSAFIALDTRDNMIKSVSPTTGQEKTLTTFTNQVFAFQKDQAGDRLFWANPMSTIKLDGTGLKSLAVATAVYPQEIPAYYFNVATDGSSVVYADSSSNDNGGGVYLFDVSQGVVQRLADNDISDLKAEIFAGASNDNRLLVFTVQSASPAEFIIREADGGAVVGRVEGQPYWQPMVP